MAGTNLLALIDDIAVLLDDVAVMTKVAAKKTAGVLGDDLALNAQQVAGVKADRELPVVWSVAKGSMWNKAILVPAALLISAFIPWLIVPLLMIGGVFLCFEGAEKLAHSFDKSDKHHQEMNEAIANPEIDMVEFEAKKIKGAIRTDFILSAEIIVISLGAIAGATMTEQVLALISIAIAMTVGVYGLVALIVKLDDMGLYLVESNKSAATVLFGRALLSFAPKLMKSLSFIGTAAMFLVGGGIISHNWNTAHHVNEVVISKSAELSQWLEFPTSLLADAVWGLIAGFIVLAIVSLKDKIIPAAE